LNLTAIGVGVGVLPKFVVVIKVIIIIVDGRVNVVRVAGQHESFKLVLALI
jgi:hypothetical protein